jgi:hypothetical protein
MVGKPEPHILYSQETGSKHMLEAYKLEMVRKPEPHIFFVTSNVISNKTNTMYDI